MTAERKRELANFVIGCVSQEARHLSDCADYDEVARDDQEDVYIRDLLRAAAEAISKHLTPAGLEAWMIEDPS